LKYKQCSLNFNVGSINIRNAYYKYLKTIIIILIKIWPLLAAKIFLVFFAFFLQKYIQGSWLTFASPSEKLKIFFKKNQKFLRALSIYL